MTRITAKTSANRWDVAHFLAKHEQHDDRWGPDQAPTFLGWGATISAQHLRIERFVILRSYRAGWRRVTLTNPSTTTTVTAYVDVTKSGLWGDGEFRIREET